MMITFHELEDGHIILVTPNADWDAMYFSCEERMLNDELVSYINMHPMPVTKEHPAVTFDNKEDAIDFVVKMMRQSGIDTTGKVAIVDPKGNIAHDLTRHSNR